MMVLMMYIWMMAGGMSCTDRALKKCIFKHTNPAGCDCYHPAGVYTKLWSATSFIGLECNRALPYGGAVSRCLREQSTSAGEEQKAIHKDRLCV
jgi:hypothetical protein